MNIFFIISCLSKCTLHIHKKHRRTRKQTTSIAHKSLQPRLSNGFHSGGSKLVWQESLRTVGSWLQPSPSEIRILEQLTRSATGISMITGDGKMYLIWSTYRDLASLHTTNTTTTHISRLPIFESDLLQCYIDTRRFFSEQKQKKKLIIFSFDIFSHYCTSC